jgi:hypothetical protein
MGNNVAKYDLTYVCSFQPTGRYPRAVHKGHKLRNEII